MGYMYKTTFTVEFLNSGESNNKVKTPKSSLLLRLVFISVLNRVPINPSELRCLIFYFHRTHFQA